MEDFALELLQKKGCYEDSSDEEMTAEEITNQVKRANDTARLFSLSNYYTYYMRNRQLTQKEYRECLELYWNNQDFYLKHQDSEALEGLEIWFMHVIEPCCNLKNISSIEEWIDRENKKCRLYTHHCSLEAKKMFRIKRNEVYQALQDLKVSRVFAADLIRKKTRKGKTSLDNKGNAIVQ